MRASSRSLGAVAALGILILVTSAPGDAPAGGARAAATPQQLAAELTALDRELRAGVDAWRAEADPPVAPPPDELIAQARRLQGTVRFLAKRPKMAKRTVRLLPGRVRRQVRHLTVAARKLRRLSSGSRKRKLKTGNPKPLAELIGHYRKAKRHHRIAPHYLAAINLVETKFGRVKSRSVAGARGPMQFIPSTWRIYGRGGNIHDPHDAILAAARLLRANGAPRRYGRALYAYNPSKLYVVAVHRYAKLIARDPHAVYVLYCWGP